MVTKRVAYQPGGDNAILRAVLYDTWDSQCYWCRMPKAYADIGIDHIIPQATSPARLAELVKELALPSDFDVHDPRNLAPSCRSCNEEKGNRDYVAAPRVLTRLRLAEGHRDEVIRKVRAFPISGKVAKALIIAREADLADVAAREAFEQHAPAVVQRLALLDEAKVEYTTFRLLEVDASDGLSLTVRVPLDSTARRAVVVLAVVCDVTLEDFLGDAARELWRTVRDEVQSRLESDASEYGDANAGPPETDFMNVDVESLTVTNHGGGLTFTAEATLEANMSASVVRSSADGYGLDEMQGDAFVAGRVTFEAEWSFSDRDLTVVDPQTDFDIDTSIT